MKYLIIGASSGLGREVAYSFAKNNHDLILVARDDRDLSPIKSDLENKFGVKVLTISLDFSSIQAIEAKILSDEKITKEISGILFPVGLMFEKDDKYLEENKINKLIYTNYVSVCFLISKLFETLSKKNTTIVGFGSVSGLLGRKVNSNYAASKRALESFFESLAFECKNTKINIQFYVLGYLDTNLSFGKELKLPKGNIKKLSEKIYNNKDKKLIKMYYPYFWNIIAFFLKIVPFSLIVKFQNFLK